MPAKMQRCNHADLKTQTCMSSGSVCMTSEACHHGLMQVQHNAWMEGYAGTASYRYDFVAAEAGTEFRGKLRRH